MQLLRYLLTKYYCFRCTPTLFEDQTNSDLPAITCFEEYPKAFDGVEENSIAFDCVEESLVAFDCVDISPIAVECVTESQVAFECDEKSHMSVECVMKNEIEDCVVGKMTSTLKSKRFVRKKRVVNYIRKHFLLEHSYTIKDYPTNNEKEIQCMS